MVSSIQGGTTAMHRPNPQQMFKKLDKNGDGGLDETELTGMAKRTKQDPAKMLAELDTDKNGSLNAEEMEAGAARHRKDGPPPENQITTALMNVLKQLKDSQSGEGAGDASGGCGGGSDAAGSSASLDELFAKQDANSDGVIDKDEFAVQAGGKRQQAPASEITTTLMNILAKLQGYSGPESDTLSNPQPETETVSA